MNLTTRPLRLGSISIGLAAVALCAPAPSSAGTASAVDRESDRREGSEVVTGVGFTAGRGERNDLKVVVDSSGALLTDRVAIRAGRGCFRPPGVGPKRVRCRFTGLDKFREGEAVFGGLRVVVRLGDRSDRAVVSGAFPDPLGDDTSSSVRFEGGRGNDRLEAAADANTFIGGDGRDMMVGGPGVDTFLEGARANGADTMIGGDEPEFEDDGVSYANRRRPVSADLQGDRDDGQLRERDRIGADVEQLIGGEGADRISGNSSNNYLAGGPGRGGRDRIAGGAGRDYLVAEPGDRVMARDGEADLVACSARGVRVQADGLDLADDCGTVRRSARAAAVLDVSNFEEPRVFSLDSGESSVTLSIGCQEDARAEACVGRVSLLDESGRVLGQAPVTGPRISNRDVTVPLSSADAALVRERGNLAVTSVLELPRVGLTRRDLASLRPEEE